MEFLSPFYFLNFYVDIVQHVVERVIPEKIGDFNNVSLSRQTITRRIAELSADIKDQVFEKSDRLISIQLRVMKAHMPQTHK